MSRVQRRLGAGYTGGDAVSGDIATLLAVEPAGLDRPYHAALFARLRARVP